MSTIITPGVPGIKPGASQSVSIGGSSTQGTAVAGNTTAVLLCATVACFVAVGSNPTAVAGTSLYLPANVPLFVGIGAGQKVAAIQASSGGTLYVTEAA